VIVRYAIDVHKRFRKSLTETSDRIAARLQRVTIADVATRAGVSATTVSRLLNGHYQAMSGETRKRIEAAVAELDYVPNRFARSLKTGKTAQLGVLVANIAHPYWAAVLSGIESASRQLGYQVLIATVGDSATVEHEYLDLLRRQVDGLLVNPTGDDWDSINTLAESGYPLVLLDRTLPGLRCNLVAMDNAAGAALGTRHLIELGHRRIAYIAYEPHNLSNRHERLEGYRHAMVEAGIEVDKRFIVQVGRSGGEAMELTRELFAQPSESRPTAALAAAGLLHLEVLAGLRQAGLRVPADVSVVGFDDSPWDPLLDPPLTTVATPAQRLGSIAAEVLVNSIRRSAPSSETRVEVALAVRASTDRVPSTRTEQSDA